MFDRSARWGMALSGVCTLWLVACGPSKDRRAAKDEAASALSDIANGAKQSFMMEGVEGAVLTAGATIDTSHRFCKSGDWQCLKFDSTAPRRCKYDYQTNGKAGADATFVATATCDPDKDGKLLTAELKGTGTASGDVTLADPTFTGDK